MTSDAVPARGGRVTRLARTVQRRLFDTQGWLMTALLTVIAAALRLPRLDQPHLFSFDETYYAKDAFSYLHFGYEREFVDNANALLLQGRADVFTSSPEFVVHPPLGKWTIALGEQLFGMNPFGWRIVMAVLGIIAVAIVHRTTLRLSGNAYTAAAAGLFMAIDGLAIVLSRTALLDQTLMFWIVVTFHALVRDRDLYRHTLALRRYGAPVPRVRMLRPWRLLAIVAITAAMSTKWSALWFAIAFAMLALAWDLGARRRADIDAPRAWLTDLAWVVVALVVGTTGYLASWIGWFRSVDAWDRGWNGTFGSLPSGIAHWIDEWVPQAIRALMYYHQQALAFHVSLTSDHPYKAAPYWWPLMLRPTSFTYESYSLGQHGCSVPSCSMEVLALGNIVIWWTASIVVLALVFLPLARLLHLRISARGWHADFTRPSRVVWDVAAGPLIGVGAGWLPWIYWHERTTFTFYSIVYAPFMCMLAAYGLQLLATHAVPVTVAREIEVPPQSDVPGGEARTPEGAPVGEIATAAPSDAPEGAEREVRYVEEVHRARLLVAVLVVVLAILFSAYFLPVWEGSVIPYDAWHARMWLPSWI